MNNSIEVVYRYSSVSDLGCVIFEFPSFKIGGFNFMFSEGVIKPIYQRYINCTVEDEVAETLEDKKQYVLNKCFPLDFRKYVVFTKDIRDYQGSEV